MSPCPNDDSLSHLLTEGLDPTARSALEDHVQRCEHCKQTLERLTKELAQQGHPRSAPLAGLPALMPPTQPDSMGRLGEYEVLAVVGRSSMGTVLKGFDPLLRRVVAIKILAEHLAATGAARQRFVREAKAIAAIHDEHVVAIHAISTETATPYLVMEFIAGITLEEHIQRHGPLETKEVLRLGLQIASGLAAAHAQGVIHRDIKPSNILLDGGLQRAKITDFGLAQAVDDASLTGSGVIIGTPLYMSPEQAESKPVDHRTDLFSLGSVLYTLCAGRPAFRAASSLAVMKRVCEDNPRPLREINADLPDWLEGIILKLLAKDPNQRFQSAREVADLLERCLSQLQNPSLPQLVSEHVQPTRPVSRPMDVPVRERPVSTGRESRRWRWILGVVLVAVLGAASLALIWPWWDGNTVRLDRPIPPGPLPPTFTNSLGIEFVLIPRGRFWMGGGGGQPGSVRVDVPYDFYLGKYEVTQSQWLAVTGKNPSSFARTGSGKNAVKDISDDDLKLFPVESVSLFDIGPFIRQLNHLAREPDWEYCMPTPAEWEYACRGGPMTDRSQSTSDFYLDQPATEITPDQANFKTPTGLRRSCKVGSYRPNRLGLYDMHGNVAERCDTARGTTGHAHPEERGGSWEFAARWGRAAATGHAAPHGRYPSLGFRLARVFVGDNR